MLCIFLIPLMRTARSAHLVLLSFTILLPVKNKQYAGVGTSFSHCSSYFPSLWCIFSSPYSVFHLNLTTMCYARPHSPSPAPPTVNTHSAKCLKNFCACLVTGKQTSSTHNWNSRHSCTAECGTTARCC